MKKLICTLLVAMLCLALPAAALAVDGDNGPYPSNSNVPSIPPQVIIQPNPEIELPEDDPQDEDVTYPEEDLDEDMMVDDTEDATEVPKTGDPSTAIIAFVLVGAAAAFVSVKRVKA